MILNRVGNKKILANKIIPLFPKHTTYIEPFFGAGGMFFSKPKALHNIVNDIDNDVYNLYYVIMNHLDEFINTLEATPLHESLFKNKLPDDKIQRAVAFLLISNYSYLGKRTTIRVRPCSVHSLIKSRIGDTIKHLQDTTFTCKDFKDFLSSLDYKAKNRNTFIYCDPPYVNTTKNAYSNHFSLDDFTSLVKALLSTNANFAISEFNHPDVTSIAKQHNLFITYISTRMAIKNTRTEILITNYNPPVLFNVNP